VVVRETDAKGGESVHSFPLTRQLPGAELLVVKMHCLQTH